MKMTTPFFSLHPRRSVAAPARFLGWAYDPNGDKYAQSITSCWQVSLLGIL